MNDLILPEIVAIGVYNTQQAVKNREVTRKRRTTMFEIELPMESGGISYINNESVPISKNLVICAKPGQLRHTRLPFKCQYIHMDLGEGSLCDLLMELPTYIAIEDPEPYRRIFDALCHYYGTGLDQDRLMLYSLILELLHLLVRSSEKQTHPENSRSGNSDTITRALQHINENLTSDLSLSAMAEFASFSPIHFHNCFKASTGKTLHQYVEEQRIRKAIQLLVNTDLTLSEIAYECGFSSQAYFSYAFKRRMQVTPRAYAEEMYNR